MMKPKRNSRMRWGLLYSIMLLTAGGLVAEHGLHLTPTGHKIMLLLVIAVIYGSLGLWVKSNKVGLQDLENEERRKISRDPAMGTRQMPTRTQAHFREVLSLYERDSPDHRKSL